MGRQKGFKHTEETIRKLRLGHLGEKNPMWRGEKVGYIGLHVWVRTRKPKPLLCEQCKIKPPFDLAIVGDKYTRNPDDWQWLCRRCHMLLDGRLVKFNDFARINHPERKFHRRRGYREGVGPSLNSGNARSGSGMVVTSILRNSRRRRPPKR